MRQRDTRAVVCSPRLGGGDRHKRPHASPLAAAPGRVRSPSLAVLAVGARRVRRRQAAPGRERALRRLPGRGQLGEVPDRSAARPDQRPAARDREHRRQDGPEPRGDDLHRRREGASGSFSVRSDQPGPRRPEPPGLDPRERLPEAAQARRGHRRAGLAAPGGAAAAQTDTFAFGPLEPGETQGPRLAGDPGGRPAPTRSITSSPPASTARRKAVDRRRRPRSKGEFVVTISDKPPQARVDDTRRRRDSEQ